MPEHDTAGQGDRRPDDQISTVYTAAPESDTAPGGQEGVSDAAPAATETGTLVIRRGPQQGTRFTLGSTTTIGRDRGCDIVLDDVTVSRRHAELRHENSQFSVSDAGSLNGTYVNRAATDKALLSDGDEIWIGKFRLVFLAGAPSQ